MKSFEEKVFSIVKKIPEGKFLTYKEVALFSGKPRAWRSVGSVLNGNPRPFVVPCHRVIRSDGFIGGYKYGIKKKSALLKKEGLIIKKGRIAL